MVGALWDDLSGQGTMGEVTDARENWAWPGHVCVH